MADKKLSAVTMGGTPIRGTSENIVVSSSAAPTSHIVNESFFKTNDTKVKIEVLTKILSNIPHNPQELLGTSNASEQKSFSYYYDTDNKEYVVIVPKNLESFADHWMLKAALAACAVLNARLISSTKDLDDKKFTYQKSYEGLIQGLAAALKCVAEKQEIPFHKYSGEFGHGFNWVCSQNEFIQSHREWFKLSYHSPLQALTGLSVWQNNVNEDQRRWYNLILLAAKKVNLDRTYKGFFKSYEDLKVLKIRHQFSWESGAVFTESERKYILSDPKLNELLESYNALKESLKSPTKDLVLSWDNEIKQYKELIDFDDALKVIATKRATIIYSTINKRRVGRGAITLMDRLSVLDQVSYITVTNPTGLMKGMDHHVFHTNASSKDLDSLIEEFTGWWYKLPESVKSDEFVSEWYNSVQSWMAKKANPQNDQEDEF